MLYDLGFVALLLAAVAAVIEWVRSRGERLAFLPGTALGWLAIALLLICVALIVLTLRAANGLDEVTQPLANVAGWPPPSPPSSRSSRGASVPFP